MASLAKYRSPLAGDWRKLIAGAAIAASAAAAYANSFGVQFVFDDLGSIPNNPSIRRLWSLGKLLHPPGGAATVEGRPVLNLSLAANYAVGGTAVRGYHVVNMAIH